MAEWHLLTGEYPPQVGGVSDYTRLVAGGLAAAGDAVHVWCPPAGGPGPDVPGVAVHREMGRFTPRDLARAGRMLDRFAGARRLLVQWVPHSYGLRSLNLAFCAWLWDRAARRGDRVELMVHEPFLAFGARSPLHNAAAAVHRVMTATLLRAASRVWVSAPLWEERWRPYALGRRVPFAWLPIPANVPPVNDAAGAAALRSALAPPGSLLLGHFGTYGADVAELLEPLLVRLLRARPGTRALLLGRGGERFRDEVLAREPALAGRITATGGLPPDWLSLHLAACDLMLQPYPAGVNARRGSLMAALQHGLPVVTTSGWLTEPVWAESGAVAMAPDGDAAALAARALELIPDAGARARLGAAAGALYDRRFDLRHTVAALRESV